MEPISTGIHFVPRYVRQVSDMEYGSVVSHENYNEKLNLNSSQGDYNTEILKLLFGETDPTKTVHIPYLDKIITDEVTRLDTVDASLQEQIDAHDLAIAGIREDMDGFNQDIINIINGVTKVGKAGQADKITGVENAGRHRYYGTDYDNNIGFHEVPDSLYAREFQDASDYVTQLIFTPAENSVAESMLTEAVRLKLNRTSITDYDQLTSRPKINNVLLTGNKSLSDLGIQPVGNYLTSIPDTYALKTYVDSAVSPKMNTTTANSTFATITALNNLSNTVTTNNNNIINNYARVGINSPVSNPRNGDLYVTV
jgi:hypothetical protein